MKRYKPPVPQTHITVGLCGADHHFEFTHNPGMSRNKNAMYFRIATDTRLDECERCVKARGYYLRPENKRRKLPA